jgi:hypothetical protein
LIQGIFQGKNYLSEVALVFIESALVRMRRVKYIALLIPPKRQSAWHRSLLPTGFNFYICHDVLFICNYDADMRFIPYLPEQESIKQALWIHVVVKRKSLKTVLSYNYSANFAYLMVGFECLMGINEISFAVNH